MFVVGARKSYDVWGVTGSLEEYIRLTPIKQGGYHDSAVDSIQASYVPGSYFALDCISGKFYVPVPHF